MGGRDLWSNRRRERGGGGGLSVDGYFVFGHLAGVSSAFTREKGNKGGVGKKTALAVGVNGIWPVFVGVIFAGEYSRLAFFG